VRSGAETRSPLSGALAITIAVIVVLYVAATELAKRWFYGARVRRAALLDFRRRAPESGTQVPDPEG
jgi:hypothetical protein